MWYTRTQARFHFVQRHGGRGIQAMIRKAFLHQGIVPGRQPRFIQLQRATHQPLPFGDG
jgi:hypothetical protein